jgi:hypothetical protein
MKVKLIVLIIILFFSHMTFSEISKKSKKLEHLRQVYEKNPTKSNAFKYLDAFPNTFKDFITTFNGHGFSFDELHYVGDKHVWLLKDLIKKYPCKVLNLCFDIATDGVDDADAVGILQTRILAEFGAKNTKYFAEQLSKRKTKQQLGIIKFIADIASHDVYHEYKEIVINLKKLGYDKLYKMFKKAKEARMKYYKP